MATISLGGHGNKKALDAAVPLVPFIDLLLCCIMFLLVTAVWNDLAGIEASQRVPAAGMDSPEPPAPFITLAVHRDAFELFTEAGDRTEIVGDDQKGQLRRTLEDLRRLHPARDLRVATDDGVTYAALIGALDQVRAAGFERIDVSGSSGP